MAPDRPRFLKLRARQTSDKDRIVEVLDGDKVVGQLPASRVLFEMLPHQIGRLTVELLVGNADVEGRESRA